MYGLLHRTRSQFGDIVLQSGDDLPIALAVDETILDHLPVVEILGRGNDLDVGALVGDVRHGDLLEGQLLGVFACGRNEDFCIVRIRQSASGDSLYAQDIFGFRIQIGECERGCRSRHFGLHGDFVARFILLRELILVTYGIGYGFPRHLEAGGSRRGHRNRGFGERRAALLFYIVAVATTREGE